MACVPQYVNYEKLRRPLPPERVAAEGPAEPAVLVQDEDYVYHRTSPAETLAGARALGGPMIWFDLV